jgi:hypothetical protein
MQDDMETFPFLLNYEHPVIQNSGYQVLARILSYRA